MPAASDQRLTDDVLAALAPHLVAVGVAPAEPFVATRDELLARRAEGLHGGMQFTYRNPDRSTDPRRIVDGAKSVIVGAFDYWRDGPERAGEDGASALAWGRVARYAWSDAYADLRQALEGGAAVLRDAGYQALVVADDNALVDREAARRAGVGWYGHNANVLIGAHGSWSVLGSIVTDAPLVPSAPTENYGCGTCTRCMSGCPTGAIVAPGVVDARRCLAWLLQSPGVFPRDYRVALGDRMYGCDDCQEVCPPNAVRVRRGPRIPAGADARPRVDLVQFLDDDDDAVVAAAGRWYVPERSAKYLRRNALLVLGNAGDPHSPAVVSALAHALRDDDPIIRAHAVWAAGRLGHHELADRLQTSETDPIVRAELDDLDAVPVRA